jgi:hypothetical protein
VPPVGSANPTTARLFQGHIASLGKEVMMIVRQQRQKQYRGVLFGVKYVSLIALVVLAALALMPAPAAESACASGLMYAVARNDPDNPTDSALYQVDKFGNMSVVVPSLGFPADAIARDPINCNQLFLVANVFAPPALRHVLFSYDLSTATVSQVGNTGLTEKANLDRLTFAPDGTLYALQADELYTIDPATGAPSLVGTVAGWSTLDGGDIAFTPDAIMWGVTGDQLFRIEDYAANPTAVPMCLGSSLPDRMHGLGVNSDGLLQVFAWGAGSQSMQIINPDPSQDPCQMNPAPFPVVYTATHIWDLTSAQGDASPTAISLVQMEVGRDATNLMLVAFLALAFIGLALLSHHQLKQAPLV